MVARTLRERLRARLVPVGDCLVWTGCLQSQGYGQLRVAGRGAVYTHRLAWELDHGPIAEGLFVCHRCDNPPCCKPHHLFLGTRSDNIRDMVSKGRSHMQREPWRVQGARNPFARLKENDVKEIIRLRASGLTLLAIAQRFGVSESTIHLIDVGKTWTHVPREGAA